MPKSEFLYAEQKAWFLPLIENVDQKILAAWAINCAERVLPYFEGQHPQDSSPRDALKTLQNWIDTGMLNMDVIRNAWVDSLAAARSASFDSAAQYAARAACEAVLTAHVPTHAIIAAIHGLGVIHRATDPANVDAAVTAERDWQTQHLLELRKNG